VWAFARVAFVASVIAVTSLLGADTAQAASTIMIAPGAKLLADGSLVARLTVTCESGHEVLEAHLTVSQDEQRISGTSGVSGIRCDGRPHRLKVRVIPQDGTFHEGEAFASGFILLLDPSTGTTEQAQHSRTIVVK
jgi:hypothetical protein